MALSARRQATSAFWTILQDLELASSRWAGGENRLSLAGVEPRWAAELESMGKTPRNYAYGLTVRPAGSWKRKADVTPFRRGPISATGWVIERRSQLTLCFVFSPVLVTQTAAPVVGQQLQGAAWRTYLADTRPLVTRSWYSSVVCLLEAG